MDPSNSKDADLQIRSLADLVLEVTEPPGDYLPTLLMYTRPVTFLAIGLLHRCREFLRLSMAAFDVGLESALAPIGRSTMEYAATGSWLLRHPRRNLRRFLLAYLFQLKGLERDAQQLANDLLNGFRPVLDHYVPAGEQLAKDLPPMYARLGAVQSAYYSYRVLSHEVHPTVAAALLAFSDDVEDEERILYRDQNAFDSGRYLGEIALWTWALASDIQRSLGFGFHGALPHTGRLLTTVKADPAEFLRLMALLDQDEE